MARTRRRLPRILCACRQDDIARDLVDCVGEEAVVERFLGAAGAQEALRTRPFAGALIDADLPGRSALRLAHAFVEHQPAGRVLVALRDPDAFTLVDLASRDPRVEVVFLPWDDDEVRRVLLGPVEIGELTGRKPTGAIARLPRRR